ncbi:hypothetical protein AURDEDRAFT_110168 [Auricularia subglabra TFB-10046 SS5]|nr:hypothetical protein AURDEDRAFT_110168 [Auricularia subglabra TFB-10046 SS5]
MQPFLQLQARSSVPTLQTFPLLQSVTAAGHISPLILREEDLVRFADMKLDMHWLNEVL